MAAINLNLEAIAPPIPARVLPEGDYPCRVVRSLLIKTRAGRPLLKFVYEVTAGPYAGARITDAMILDHEAGLSRLKNLAVRAGHPDPNRIADSEELHGLGFLAKVCVEEDDSGRAPARNQVRAYACLGGTPRGGEDQPA